MVVSRCSGGRTRRQGRSCESREAPKRADEICLHTAEAVWASASTSRNSFWSARWQRHLGVCMALIRAFGTTLRHAAHRALRAVTSSTASMASLVQPSLPQ